MKKLTYYFKVGAKEYKVKAESAGSAMQWMNRLLGLPETAVLTAPAAGWT